jgi:phosphate acetyltransferase
MEFIKKLEPIAKKINARIVFPESEDKRILEAVSIIIKKNIAKPILIGNKRKVLSNLKKFKIANIDKKIEIIEPKKYNKSKLLIDSLYGLRKHKGLKINEAKSLILNNRIYFGTMLVQNDFADALIAGATSSTAETVRPAFQIIKTKKKDAIVSGLFFMELNNEILLFADCAVNMKPSSSELARIAIDTAETAKQFNIQPRIAMLSFSTNSSAKHEEVDKVKEATKIAKHFSKNKFKIDGEMQVDSAIVPSVSKLKFPKSKIKGNANILIFPDLNSGNIAYKLVERLAKAKAIGPVLQGLKKPVNDLSRGCSVQDIVDLAIITSIQCKHD